MKALYLKDQLLLENIPLPVPQKDEAVVKVSMAGICNTDLELIKGYMGFQGVLGHEFVGVVESAEAKDWPGKRVCGEINFGCGKCDMCLKGLSRHCPERTVLGILNQNGAFAEYVLLPVDNLNVVPDAIPNEHAVFVEPLAAALDILEQIKIEPGHKVAVIGDGKLGLLICQVLRLSGADIHLFGKHERKLNLARKWQIRTHLPKEPLAKIFDVVVEVSGSASGFSTALNLLKPRGTMVLKSTYHGNLEINAAPIVIDEISIVGSRCGPFAAAIRVLEKGLIDVQSLIDKVFSFDDIIDAFEYAKLKRSLKVIVDFNA